MERKRPSGRGNSDQLFSQIRSHPTTPSSTEKWSGKRKKTLSNHHFHAKMRSEHHFLTVFPPFFHKKALLSAIESIAFEQRKHRFRSSKVPLSMFRPIVKKSEVVNNHQIAQNAHFFDFPPFSRRLADFSIFEGLKFGIYLTKRNIIKKMSHSRRELHVHGHEVTSTSRLSASQQRFSVI